MRHHLCLLLAKYAGQELTRALAVEMVNALCTPAPEHQEIPAWELWTHEALLDLVCGDADAAQFIYDMSNCSHFYDDLIDGDKAISAEEIHKSMWAMLIAMPANPFFIRHREALLPVMTTGLLNWRAANDMELSGDVEQLRIAHATRYSLIDVVLLCMVLCGGPEHAAKNARKARLMGQKDTWKHYHAEHFLKEDAHVD